MYRLEIYFILTKCSIITEVDIWERTSWICRKIDEYIVHTHTYTHTYTII